MATRMEQVLRRADRGDYILALLPTMLFILPATPYLAYPLIMWLKVPWMLQRHGHWLSRSYLILAGLLLCASLSLLLVRWASALGRRRARELLTSTDILLYAMLHDSDATATSAGQGLALDIFRTRDPGTGAYAQRIARLAAHFDRWCKALNLRYEPPPLRTGLYASLAALLLATGWFLWSTPVDSFFWLITLCLALPVTLIYLHAAACGLRIGARRALLEHLQLDERRKP